MRLAFFLLPMHLQSVQAALREIRQFCLFYLSLARVKRARAEQYMKQFISDELINIRFFL